MNRQSLPLRDLIRRCVVVALVATGTTLGLLAAVTPHASRAQTGSAPLRAGLPDFADLAEKVGPAVVNIRTVLKPTSAVNPALQGIDDEQLQEFIRRMFGLPSGPATPRFGLGSGFVLTADGYVMTNAHVVKDADEVRVTFTDKRELKAIVVGVDARTDVAVLKVDATGLPAVKIGDVSRLRVGEWVIAIGSPFGLDNSVTAGIVSAKGRETGEFLPFIQTDVAINPGNSGGPLINMRGEVVGINSQLLSNSGAYAGVSLSIPIDDAMQIADQLRATGRVTRGQLGVRLGRVNADVAEAIGLGKSTGAEVRAVIPGGAADKVGVEAGDVITRFNGKVIDNPTELSRLVAAAKPGVKATVQVFRRGKYRDVEVVLDEQPGDGAAAGTSDPSKQKQGAAPSASALGLAVADLTPPQKRELKLRGGVRVSAVGGAAARAGLLPNDLVLQVGDVEVTDARQFETLLSKLGPGKPVLLLVRRGPWTQYVLVGAAR